MLYIGFIPLDGGSGKVMFLYRFGARNGES